MAELSQQEIAAAERIVLSWDWQIAEAHNYSFEHGLHTLTRFYESAPMESDEFRLVLRYLKSQNGVKLVNINHKGISLDGEWKAKDAWYQTANGDHFEGTEQNRVRIYQTLVGRDDDDAADGPYTVENGCKYKVSHVFFWDVASLPSLESGEYASGSGVQYSMQGLTRDKETGLFSCVIERRETVRQDIEYYGSAKTIFENRENAVHLGVRQDEVATTGDESSVGDGVLIERHLSKNADCTTDVANVKTTEQAVADATKTYRKTLRGTIETIVNRNQKTALTKDGMKVGETRQSDKTPGGLYNNTKTKVESEAGGKITASCTKTIFEHQHSTLENQIAAPESDDVNAAEGGVVHRQTSRMTEEGTFDVEKTETTEQAVADATKTYRKTLRGTIETTVNRNQPTALTKDGMAIGETRQSDKTPGGLYNNTKTEVTPEKAGVLSQSCEKQKYEHTDTKLENQLEDPGEIEQNDVGTNTVISKSVRKTDEGSWDVQTTTRTYSKAEKTVAGGTLNRKEKITVSIHDTTVEDGEPDVNVQDDVSATPNEHGSFTVSHRTTTFVPNVVVSTSNYATDIIKTTVTTHDENLAPAAALGEASGSPNDHGSATTSITEHTPKEVDSNWIEWDSTSQTPHRTYKYRHGIRVFVNKKDLPPTPRGTECSVSVSINRFGLYDGHMSYSELTDWTENSGGGGVVSGFQQGTATLYEHRQDSTGKRYVRTVSLNTIAYYGSGNEGSEASDRTNQILYPGARLDSRTYIKSVTKGAWTPDV